MKKEFAIKIREVLSILESSYVITSTSSIIYINSCDEIEIEKDEFNGNFVKDVSDIIKNYRCSLYISISERSHNKGKLSMLIIGSFDKIKE